MSIEKLVKVIQETRKARKDLPSPTIPKPTNRFIRKNLTTMRRAKRAITRIRARCKHDNVPIGCRASDDFTGYTVGIFDTTLVCKKCGTQYVVKKSPPICSCCLGSCVLKAWEGKKQNGATKEQLSVWKKEHARRRKLFMDDTLSYDMFFTQIGLYVCENHECGKVGDPVFVVTPGD